MVKKIRSKIVNALKTLERKVEGDMVNENDAQILEAENKQAAEEAAKKQADEEAAKKPEVPEHTHIFVKGILGNQKQVRICTYPGCGLTEPID